MLMPALYERAMIRAMLCFDATRHAVAMRVAATALCHADMLMLYAPECYSA